MRCFNLVDTPAEIVDGARRADPPRHRRPCPLRECSAFGYEADREILKGIDLEVRPGR
jgi:hypothetical protein